MLRALIVRLRSLLRHQAVEAELDQELQYHLELDAERLVARGLDPAESRRGARSAMSRS